MFDLNSCEEQDKLSIELKLKEYKKALRYLFRKYSNTGYNRK